VLQVGDLAFQLPGQSPDFSGSFLPLSIGEVGIFQIVFHFPLQGLIVFPGVAHIPPQAPLHAAEEFGQLGLGLDPGSMQGGGYGFLQVDREMGRSMARLKILDWKIGETFPQLGD
jgi:hypothetical protein